MIHRWTIPNSPIDRPPRENVSPELSMWVSPTCALHFRSMVSLENPHTLPIKGCKRRLFIKGVGIRTLLPMVLSDTLPESAGLSQAQFFLSKLRASCLAKGDKSCGAAARRAASASPVPSKQSKICLLRGEPRGGQLSRGRPPSERATANRNPFQSAVIET